MMSQSQPCYFATCQQPSHVLCYCCNKTLCLDHLSAHNHSTFYNSLPINDQIHILNEQFKRLNVDELVYDSRLKLDKWRDESLKKVQRFYEKKCEELEQYYVQRIRQHQRKINQLNKKYDELNQRQWVTYNGHSDENTELKAALLELKQNGDEIEQKAVPMNIHFLSIENNLISIGGMTTQGFDLLNLKSPYQTITSSPTVSFELASSDDFLLVGQNMDLNLFDRDLKMIRQYSWNDGAIHDLCWSSNLDSFIAITENSNAFLIDGNRLLIREIEALQNQLWVSCTCSNSSLYLVSLNNAIVEFTILPSFNYLRRWDPPISCKKNEHIKHIACNDIHLAILVAMFLDNMVHLIVRSVPAFDSVLSIRLDIKYPSYELPMRCCILKNSEWLVSDANTSQLIHIDKEGQIKGTTLYDEPPYNVVLFGKNILAIRTKSSLNFHRLLS